MPKLSIVIVSYNVKYYVAQCITSVLRSQGGVDADITVVDNHSQDGTVEFLRKRFPSVKVVASNHNLGFARANNIAIKATTGEYVLLLNPDTIVGEDVLSECISFMGSHPHCGGLGLRMLNVNGEVAMESRRGLPTPMTSFYKMTGLCSRFPKSRRFGRYYLGFLPWDEPV
ncbi:MAG: glycosyltransferase, partial [Prevotella sp.]|nr:glycosyltransferase [Prevotella sp.]